MVIPFIDLAPETEGSALASQYASWARARLAERPMRRRDFEALRGAIAVVTTDANEALTLRFDGGRVTVHGGVVGVPELALRGTREALAALAEAGMAGRAGASFAAGLREGGRAVLGLARMLAERRVRVHGAWMHMAFALRLARFGFAHD
jgi:hypothetical protein